MLHEQYTGFRQLFCLCLGNATELQLHGYRKALQSLVFKLFTPPPMDEIIPLVDKTTSLVIVRHPMSRKRRFLKSYAFIN